LQNGLDCAGSGLQLTLNALDCHIFNPVPTIFHEPAIQLVVDVHAASLAKHAKAPNDLVRDAFFVLSHDSVRVHRAVGHLVDSGWSAPGAALLRTLVDISISAIAVSRSAQPKLAAFKYLYSGLRRHSRDQKFTSAQRRGMFAEIRRRLDQLPDPLRAEALVVAQQKDRPYWFAPEWSSPSMIIDQHGDPDMKWVYMQLSAAAHGSYLGMRLFRDNPDEISINADPIGPRALTVDLTSARWLIEIARIRADVEGLDFEDRITDLAAQIGAAVAELRRDAV
jgi:hypothetical protein